MQKNQDINHNPHNRDHNPHNDDHGEGGEQRPGQHGDHGRLVHAEGHQGRGGLPQGGDENINCDFCYLKVAMRI